MAVRPERSKQVVGGRRRKKGGSLTRQPERSGSPSKCASEGARSASPELISRTEMMYAVSLRGPLPPPQILERYDQIVPGGAERIVGWVEKQSSHRQDLERIKVVGDVGNEKRGQWFAFVITLLTLAASVYLISQDKDTSGLALILTELAVLAGVFIYGRESQRREREKIREELIGGEDS